MPQFRPFRWVNYLIWTFITLILALTVIQKVYLPRILKLNRVRMLLAS